ncbi:hypothetical protein OPV22_010312 [Ensete ventricosum]|uniref:Uncharacterized protein n=1 Tax=Ensete ventricosum TaxID=4639 RepID=A0AAV8Q270_ENSVE|nr:hypothetical protein OPV22_010312 [Ensete ventricosum]
MERRVEVAWRCDPGKMERNTKVSVPGANRKVKIGVLPWVEIGIGPARSTGFGGANGTLVFFRSYEAVAIVDTACCVCIVAYVLLPPPAAGQASDSIAQIVQAPSYAHYPLALRLGPRTIKSGFHYAGGDAIVQSDGCSVRRLGQMRLLRAWRLKISFFLFSYL